MARKEWKVGEGVGKNERMWEGRGGCGNWESMEGCSSIREGVGSYGTM